MPILLLLDAALPSAFAGDAKPIGEASVSGVVEAPLYAGLSGQDVTSYVEATVGEKKLLLRLATGHRKLLLSEGAVGTLGLKASGAEGKKTVKVETLSVGGATFSGLRADVGTVAPSGAFAVDGELGLPGFEGLAYAILPSTGVLRLATGGDGVSLVSAVGAAAPAASDWKELKVQVGDKKAPLTGTPVLVGAKWSGVEVGASLAIEASSSWVAREVEGADWFTVTRNAKPLVDLPDAPGYQAGEVREEWRDVALAGASAGTYVRRPGKGPVALVEGSVMAQVGADVLGGLDLAVDPVSGTYAVKAAGASKRVDYAPTYEAALRAALEPKPGADGAAPSEDAAKAARKGGLGALTGYLEARGRFDEAVAARKELAEGDADACASWTSFGKALVSAGRAAEAIEPLTKASALYQPWAALTLPERADLAKDFAAAEKKKEAWTGLKPQDHACHVAPGLLAVAEVQAKNTGAVAALYPAQLDLDATLPLAAGNAALLQGQFEAAHAAYLQALKLAGGDHDAARVGIYLALASKDFEQARKQLERLRLRFGGATDPLLVRLYTEGVRASQGAAGVLGALDALLAADPSDPVLLAQRSRERASSGDASGAAVDWAAAEERFAARLAAAPSDADALAAWASALAAAGQAGEAQKAADAAVKLAPGSGKAWLAAADAADATGDAGKAAEARVKAGLLWASHPGYALLLAQ